MNLSSMSPSAIGALGVGLVTFGILGSLVVLGLAYQHLYLRQDPEPEPLSLTLLYTLYRLQLAQSRSDNRTGQPSDQPDNPESDNRTCEPLDIIEGGRYRPLSLEGLFLCSLAFESGKSDDYIYRAFGGTKERRKTEIRTARNHWESQREQANAKARARPEIVVPAPENVPA